LAGCDIFFALVRFGSVMGLFAFSGSPVERLEKATMTRKAACLCLYLAVAFANVLASPPATRDNPVKQVSKVAQEAVKWLSEYVQINTANPPGREIAAAEYLAQLLRREGISCQTAISAPGRANLVARLKGRSPGGGVALVHHMDVATVDADSWSVPPFSGMIRDGYVWGRGTVDSKGLGIAHLAALVAIKRSGRPPRRDVVFLATSDEEMGGEDGMAWVLENRPEWLKGIDYALTEGGANIVRDNRLAHVGIETTQKLALWLRLTAVGEPMHGAYVNRNAASHRLIRALDRLLRYRPEILIAPAVARYFREIAAYQSPEIRDRLLHLDELTRDPESVRRLDPGHQALLRNTIAVSVVRAGSNTNAFSGTAYAELDCRLVPDQEPEEFLETVTEVVDDENIVIEPLLISSPAASPTDSELYEAIRTATQSIERQATLGSSVLAGFTDGRFLRERGIVSYGFDPFKASNGDLRGVHGIDEKLSISDLEFAIRYCHSVLSEFVFSRDLRQQNGLARH